MPESAVAPAPAAPAAAAPEAPVTPAAAAPAPAATAAYALIAPQGSNFDSARIDTSIAAYKATGLPPEHAQMALEREWQIEASISKANEAALATESKAWRKANEADPDYGGQKLAESDAGVTSLFTRFSTPEFAQRMRETGLIHAPGLHKMLVNISRALGEKPLAQPTAPTPAATDGTPFDSPDWKQFLASRKK